MAKQPAVSDATLTRRLPCTPAWSHRSSTTLNVGSAATTSRPPTPTCPPEFSMRLRTARSARRNPAPPSGPSSRYSERVDWWVDRIGLVGGLAAAAPRFAGALADRVPLQAALGASAAGLAVCAVAREHGRTTAAEWVPLLARVLFDRDLSAQARPSPLPRYPSNSSRTPPRTPASRPA